MKTKVLTSIILVAMILTTVLTGCGATDTNKDTATVDQAVVATEETTAPTEAETEEETVAPTEKETEADKEKSDADEDNKDKEDSKEDSPASSNTSNNKNNSTSSSSSATNTNKNNSSSSSSSSNKKPSSNSGSSSSTNKKPSSNSGSSNNKPATVVTDDTKLTHAQFSTYDNMQRICNHLNNYYQNKGMTLNSSFNINNCGWLFAYQGSIDKTATRSYNEQLNRIIICVDEQIDGLIALDGYTYDYTAFGFYCYAEQQSDGEYNIYFCYG